MSDPSAECSFGTIPQSLTTFPASQPASQQAKALTFNHMPTRVKSPVCGCQEEWFINQPEGSHFMLSYYVSHCGRVISFAFQGPIYFSLHFPLLTGVHQGVAVALYPLKWTAMTILFYLDEKGACVLPVSHSTRTLLLFGSCGPTGSHCGPS